MAMKWLEGELRSSGLPGDDQRANSIKNILLDRGSDIPLPIESILSIPEFVIGEPLVPERNPEGYLNLAKEIMRILPRAPRHRPLRDRLESIRTDPEIVDQISRDLELVMTHAQLTKRQRYVLTEVMGLEGLAPKSIDYIGGKLGVSNERVEDIKRSAIDRLRRRSGLDKISPYFDPI